LGEKIRQKVFQLWLEGSNYRAIEREAEAKLGSISNIINAERARSPDLDDLRALNIQLKAGGVSVPDARRGAVLMRRLDESKLSVDFDRLARVIGFADEHGDSADEAMDAGFKMQGLEAATGKNYDQLLKEYGSVRDSVEKETSRLKEVQRKESDVQESLGEMEPLKEVKSKLDAHGIPVVRLDGFIALYDKLEKLGFTEQAADILATEMSKLGTTPRKAAKQLSEALAEYATLQEALEGQREEHSELRKQLELLNEEVMEKGGELRKAKEELRTIQGGIEDQRTAYEKDKEEMGKNSAGLKSQIGELTDQIRRLEATKKGLEGALESSDELLEAIEAKAAKNEKLQLILSLFGEGIPPLPRRQMLETMAALGGSFVAYLGFFEQKTPVVDNLIGKVVQMDDAIELVLRNTR